MRYRKHSQDSEQSETPGMHGNSTRENRETLSTSVVEDVAAGRLEKALSQKSNMRVGRESDGRVVNPIWRISRVRKSIAQPFIEKMDHRNSSPRPRQERRGCVGSQSANHAWLEADYCV